MGPLRRAAAAGALLVASGCTPGFLYTNIRTPLVHDMVRTPRGSTKADLSAHHIEEPLTSANLSADWNSFAIGEAAKEAGLEKAYFADLHTISIFGGLYRRRTVEVWGE